MPEKNRLDEEFDRLDPHLPAWGTRWLRRIRAPAAIWARVPVGVVLILAGFLGFLPILGFWMVPLGLALIALDVPFMRGPLASVLSMINQRLEARAGSTQAAEPSPRPPAPGRPE